MREIYATRDPVTNDGIRLDTDDRERLHLTIELAGAPPRTLVIVNRGEAERLAHALLSEVRDPRPGLPLREELAPRARRRRQ